MKQGETIWVRDISNMSEKTRCTFEFEKDSQIVVSFDNHSYLCVFDKSCIVDPPSDGDAEIDEANEVLAQVFETTNLTSFTRKIGYYHALESIGYKLVRMEVNK